MKTAPWRVWSLVNGLLLTMTGLVTWLGAALVHFFVQPIPWSVGAVVLVGLFTVITIGAGMSFLLDLCRETDEDRRQQAEINRLVEDLQEELKQPLACTAEPEKTNQRD